MPLTKITGGEFDSTQGGLSVAGIITATSGFVGNLTGSVSGNVTGNVNATGLSTFSGGPVLIGGGTSTGTASQPLQVTGGAYVSGSVGIGSTNPARKLDVVDSGASGSVIRSKVTTNNGGYLAYEALSSSGTSVFSVTHNGRINLSENVVFASGQGLDFSATANSSGTMTSELLDDYEYGTWTPTAYLAYNPSGRSVSTSTNSGKYIKTGRLVTVHFTFTYSLTGSGGFNMGVQGLPYTAVNDGDVCGGARESQFTGFSFICESVGGGGINALRRYDNGSPNDPSGQMIGYAVYRSTS